MLQKKTIEPNTLELLKKLLAEPEARQFALAGGTGLSLILGHRKSFDLDFFSYNNFNADEFYNLLKDKGYVFDKEIFEISKNTVNAYINGIKVQFLGHLYNQLKPIIEIEGVRLYDIEDIAAMKLNAIANRGAKKDFWDFDELLDKYSLANMLDFYSKKYDQNNFQYVLKSLTYFKDADSQPDPISFKKKKWSNIKKRVSENVKLYVTKSISRK